MRNAGKMHHMTDTFEQGRPVGGVRQVWQRQALDALHRGDRRWIARGALHLEAASRQRPHQRCADEARGAGDEHGALHLGPLASAWSSQPVAAAPMASKRRAIAGERASTAAMARHASSSPSRNTRAVTCGTLNPLVTAR